jgi:KDO2-lipid IV(A) lauroyltransferase
MNPRAAKHGVELAAFYAARAAWALLPERVALASGAALGAAVGSLLRLRRADVDRHLAWAFPASAPEWRARVARACYRHFGREAAATLRAAQWPRERVVERTRLLGFAAFEEAVRAGAGVVLLTGHLGNWELGGAAIAARGIPLDVVGKGMSNRRFERELFQLRERIGMRVIGMGDAPRLALRSLGSGRVVALLADQSAPRGGVLVPFFGRPAPTARGPALFALRSGAPVFVAFALRDRGPEARYTLTFARLEPALTGALDRDVEVLMGSYHRELEAAVTSAPEQYLWHHRRWNRAPAGAGAPASQARGEGRGARPGGPGTAEGASPLAPQRAPELPSGGPVTTFRARSDLPENALTPPCP